MDKSYGSIQDLATGLGRVTSPHNALSIAHLLGGGVAPALDEKIAEIADEATNHGVYFESAREGAHGRVIPVRARVSGTEILAPHEAQLDLEYALRDDPSPLGASVGTFNMTIRNGRDPELEMGFGCYGFKLDDAVVQPGHGYRSVGSGTFRFDSFRSSDLLRAVKGIDAAAYVERALGTAPVGRPEPYTREARP